MNKEFKKLFLLLTEVETDSVLKHIFKQYSLGKVLSKFQVRENSAEIISIQTKKRKKIFKITIDLEQPSVEEIRNFFKNQGYSDESKRVTGQKINEIEWKDLPKIIKTDMIKEYISGRYSSTIKNSNLLIIISYILFNKNKMVFDYNKEKVSLLNITGFENIFKLSI